MKWLWRHIGVVVGLTVWLCWVPCASAQPQLHWLEREYDFGTFMEAGGKVSHVMRMVNTGDQPLVIERVTASCGCTAVTWPHDPVMAGDTASLQVTYDPSGRPGVFEKQVLVYSNGEPRRSVLRITGNVIATEETLAKQYPLRAGRLLLSAGQVPLGSLVRGVKGKMEYVSCLNASLDTLVVHANAGNARHVHVGVVPDTVPPGKVTAVTVHYEPALAPLWGLNVDTVTVVSDPLPGGQTVKAGGIAQIEVMAVVTEDMSGLTEEQLAQAPVLQIDGGQPNDVTVDCGTIARGTVTRRTLSIGNAGRQPLLVRRVWVPGGEGVSVSVDHEQVKRGKQATVTVEVDGSKVNDKLLNTRMSIMTNDPERPVVDVRVVGVVEE